MTKQFTHEFMDFLQPNGHTCLPILHAALRSVSEGAIAIMKEEHPEQDASNMAKEIANGDQVLSAFEGQLSAFLRGYLVGHGGHGSPEEIMTAALDAMCPVCINYWAQAHDECCIGHAIEHFMEQALSDCMSTIDLSGLVPAHGDPNLN